MNKLEQLKELMQALTSEELEQLKALVNAPSGETAEGKNPDTETNDKEGTQAETPEVETKDQPQAEGEQTAPQAVKEELPSEADKTEDNVSPPTEELPTAVEDDEIPAMQKGVPAVDEEAEPIPQVTAEDGGELPIDYEQIIEAQNAKIAALQAENSSLKNKVEGAFGYSSKPVVPTKVNRLYDDAEDVHFHK